jgi:hypothetical protein
MDGLLIQAEREQLDHQRARIEEILAAQNMVSPETRTDLQRLLTDITQRLWELGCETDHARLPDMVQWRH